MVMNLRSGLPTPIQDIVFVRATRAQRSAQWFAWSAFLICLGMVIASLLLSIKNGRNLHDLVVEEITVTIAILALAFSLTGALIASRRPENPIGWIFCAAALFQGSIIFGEEYATYALITRPDSLPLGREMSWLKEWIWAPGLGLILVFLPLLFPDGRMLTPRWRWVAWLGGLSIGLISGLYMVALWPWRGLALMQAGGEAERSIAPIVVLMTDFVAFPVMLLAALAAVISQSVRFRKASGIRRQQIKWFISASALTLAFAFIYEGLPKVEGGATEVVLVFISWFIVPSIPLATGIAILRYRLYDIDLIINRALVYGTLTICTGGIYVLVVGYAGTLIGNDGNLLISLIGTGAVAVLFAPLRDRLQQGFNRLMYGERNNPYAVLSRLGVHLRTTTAPEGALQTIVNTAAEALRLPYAAIELKRGGKADSLVECGRRTWGDLLILPLAYGT